MEDDSKVKRNGGLPMPVAERDAKKPRVEMKGTGSPMDALSSSKGLSKAVTGVKTAVRLMIRVSSMS
jgi:hypothetical protein